MTKTEKLLVAFMIGLGITFYSYICTADSSGQSPAMGINGLIFQHHNGLPFYYQTLTVEQIPVVQNSSKGLIETTIYTHYYEFNPFFFLLDWMIWTLPIEAAIFFLYRKSEEKVEDKKQ